MVSTYCHSHYPYQLVILQLLEPPCALTVERRLPKRNLPVSLVANRIWRGVLTNLASAPQVPPLCNPDGEEPVNCTALVPYTDFSAIIEPCTFAANCQAN